MSYREGDTFKKTFIISNEIHKGFIELFKDSNPLHTDEKFAADNGFEGIVMHGNILNGFISYFVGECLPTKNVIIHLQEIQFKHPMYLYDVLEFKAVITDLYESVNAIEFKFDFTNRELKKVAKGKLQIGLLK